MILLKSKIHIYMYMYIYMYIHVCMSGYVCVSVLFQVVPKSLNPNWKQQFDMRLYHGDSTTLHIEVWDRDLLYLDDFIGQ